MLEAISQLKESLPSLSSFRFGLGAIDLSPLGLGGRGVGLDVGEERVRAALVKKKGHQLILAGVGVSEIAYAVNEGAITQAILEALESAGRKRRDPVACSVRGPEVIVKAVKLPALPLNRVLEAVKWHFQENGLLASSDAVFDAQILQPTNGGQMNILAVCAPITLIGKRLRMLEGVHITPSHMDVEPLVNLNAFLALEGIEQDETLVMISLNDPVPCLCLFNRQNGETLIRYIPEALVSAAAAVEGIRTSVAYYQAEIAPGSSLRCIYCVREEGFLQLKEKMADHFSLWNLSTAPATFDPLAIMEWEGSILPPGESIDGTELAQAVGLALRAL